MKKIITIIAILTIAQGELFGHATTITRSWCGGFFHRKFEAFAQTTALRYSSYQGGVNRIGQNLGTNPIGTFGLVCSDRNRGCSRPQTATCGPHAGTVHDIRYSGCIISSSTLHSYETYAKSEHLTSGVRRTFRTTGRGNAGFWGDYELDSLLLSQLDDNGYSYGDISGDVEVSLSNNLIINNLNGILSIKKNSNFYSTLKVIII